MAMAMFGGAGCVALKLNTGSSNRMVRMSAAKTEEKGFLDWLLQGLDKESFSETDPILNKVDSGNGAPSARPPSKAPPSKNPPPAEKKGWFFGK